MCDDCFVDGEIDATVFATMHDIDRRDDNYATGAAVAFGLIALGTWAAERQPTTAERLEAMGFGGRPCVLHSFPLAGGSCVRCGFDDGFRPVDGDREPEEA